MNSPLSNRIDAPKPAAAVLRRRAPVLLAALAVLATAGLATAGHGPVSTRRLTQPDPLRPGSEMLEQSTVQKGTEFTLRVRPKAVRPGDLVSFEAAVRDLSSNRPMPKPLKLRIDRLGLWGRELHTAERAFAPDDSGAVKFSEVFLEPGTYEVVFRLGPEDDAGLLVVVQGPAAAGGWRTLGVFFGVLGLVCLATVILGPRGRLLRRMPPDPAAGGGLGA